MRRLLCTMLGLLLFLISGCGNIPLENPWFDHETPVKNDSTDEPGKSVPGLAGGDFEDGTDINLDRVYEWDYGGRRWFIELSIPQQLYSYYAGRKRTPFFSQYVTDSGQHEHISALAEELSEAARSQDYSLYQTVEFILSFIQSIDYALDIDSKGVANYPRYPLETLVDGVADCKDTSILFASLLHEMEIGVVLILLPDHMAIGVAGEDLPGVYYEHGGVRYYYVETTGQGWGIGEIPPEYHDQPAELVFLR